MFGLVSLPQRGSKFSRRLHRRSPIAAGVSARSRVYKGTGARTEGSHTAKGGYVVRPERLMKIVAPDLKGFQLKPYVATGVRPPAPGQRIPVFAGDAAKPQQLR